MDNLLLLAGAYVAGVLTASVARPYIDKAVGMVTGLFKRPPSDPPAA